MQSLMKHLDMPNCINIYTMYSIYVFMFKSRLDLFSQAFISCTAVISDQTHIIML